jgi:hypothetical protein
MYRNVGWINWICVGIACFWVADGGDGLHTWRVFATILNKHSRTADKGWPSSLGVGRGADNSSPLKTSMLQGLGFGRILWNDVGNGKRL